MRRALAALACTSTLVAAAPALAQQPGPVSPTQVAYTFTSVSLIDTAGGYRSLTEEPFSYTFARSAPDLSPVTIQEATVPFGRYAGMSVCFDSTVQITLDGVRYDGPSGALFEHGDVVYSVGTDGGAQGAVSKTSTGAPTTLAFSVSTSPQNCTSYYFPAPVCVTDTPGSDCRQADDVHLAGDDAGNDAGLSLSLLVDLFHSVVIDADSGRLWGVPILQVTAGAPGASIHLSAFENGVAADVSMLFGPNRTLLSAFASKWPLFGGLAGMCAGQSDVFATAAPPGAPPLPNGPAFIGLFDSRGLGEVQTPVTARCPDTSDCTSTGVNVIKDLLQPVGASASISCVPDASATPPYLGYTYVGGNGGDGSTVTLPITRIVDTAGLFGVCDAQSDAAVAGHPGTCSASDTAGDGYP